ncbi:MAG: hypothetical protein OXH39_20145 [Candidatus Poribacteria bacterium]|nr:hypothetical protein [Candidatus Poribacteria bacterium]
MFEVQLPMLKKLQNVAGGTAGIGFILGTLIPAVAIFILDWQCPFGDGIFRIGGFLVITGFGSAIVFGNLVALALIGFAKYRQISSNSSKERK